MHLVTQKKKQEKDLYQLTINLFWEKHPLFFQLKNQNKTEPPKPPTF